MRLLALVMLMLVTAARGMGDDAEEWERLMGEPMDKSRWIDPWDMGLASDQEPRTCPDLETRVGTCERELTACKETLESSRAGCNKSAAEERLRSDPDVFLRRFVNHLVYKLGLEVGQESHLKLGAYLSPGQTQTLLNFAKFQSPTPAVDVDTILSSLIRNVESYETSPFVDNLKVRQNEHTAFIRLFLQEQLASLKDPVLVLLASIALVYLSMIVFRRLPPFKVFMLLLCVSLVWHSVLLYKDALASQQVKLMKDVPAECKPGEMSFLQSVSSYVSQGFSNVDKCAEYHKVMKILTKIYLNLHSISGSASGSNLRN